MSKTLKKKSKNISNPVTNHWLYKHYDAVKTVARAIFGVFWLSDGLFKFVFDNSTQLLQATQSSAVGQPGFLKPWFDFWIAVISISPHLFRLLIGGTEIFLGIFLILGFLRKPVYIIGLIFSLLLWSVGEGFGGPYGPGVFDIGTGIIYAMVFLCFIIFSVIRPTKEFSLDSLILRHKHSWAKYCEF